MLRCFLQLIMACAMGFCQAEHPEETITTEGTRCICKPVMRIEFEPTTAICNNATFDWLLTTVLSQVSNQNTELSTSRERIGSLENELQDKEKTIANLNAKIESLTRELQDMRKKNSELEDIAEHSQEHRAFLNPRPHDCADVQRYGFHYSGIYTVYPPKRPDGIEVFCDLNTDGGGWLVFQRRQDGEQTFHLLWEDYKSGFGKIAKEFWIGNEKLHILTGLRPSQLRIDLTDYHGNRYYATYDAFGVDDEQNKYTLHIGKYQGNAGDGLGTHNNWPFSTTDKDNDGSRSGNCAELYGGGGWWWARCYDSNLNGIYSNRHLYETTVWYPLRNNHEPMRHVEMKMRPMNFKN